MDPTFPTKERYYRANFTIEGLERKNWDEIEDDINLDYYNSLRPEPVDADLEGISEWITPDDLR